MSADYLLGIIDVAAPYYQDSFGQLSLFPQVDYSFVKEASWDLLKLIDSGIVLIINNKVITNQDKRLLNEIISSIFNRLQEVTRETEERTKILLNTQISDEPTSDNSLL